MKTILWAGIISVISVVPLRAELLVATPSNAPFAGRVAVGEYGLGPTYPVMQARPMTTGSSAWNLTALSFGSSLTHAGGTGGIRVSIYTDSASLPGTVVPGGLNLFSANPAGISQTLPAGSSLTLAANTTYWLVVSADQSADATRYWWDLTDSAAVDSGVPGFGLPLTGANNVNGWTAYPGSSMQLAVYGQAVPEPMTLSFFGVGSLGSWLLRSRRQRRLRRSRPSGPQFEELEYRPSFLQEERLAGTLSASQ